MATFLSKALNKVDAKGRVSVPAAWRSGINGQAFNGVVLFRSFKFEAIEGCDWARMDELVQRHDSLDQYSEEWESLATIFANSHQLAFDSEGRISLPEELAQHAGIADRAMMVGVGRMFQIWEPDRYTRHEAEMRERARRQGAVLPGRKPGPAAPGAGS